MRGKSRAKHLALSVGLPEDALGGGARVTMTGRSGVLVEGQSGVIELGQTRVRLRTGSGVLTVTGARLCLRELSVDAALICGDDVEAVSYGKGQ